MTPKERKSWIKKLKPFWIFREIAHNKFRKREHEIEKAMSKLCKEELEFFYSDGGCCGIGHADLSRRYCHKKNYFPLIHDRELE